MFLYQALTTAAGADTRDQFQNAPHEQRMTVKTFIEPSSKSGNLKRFMAKVMMRLEPIFVPSGRLKLMRVSKLD